MWGPFGNVEDGIDVSRCYRREIIGYDVRIEGWEQFSFFVWKADGEVPQWSVSERLTGCSITMGSGAAAMALTRSQAVDVAVVRLERNGMEYVRELVQKYSDLLSMVPNMLPEDMDREKRRALWDGQRVDA